MKFGKLVDLELQMKEHMIVDALDSVFEVFDESLETLESLQTAVDTMKNGDMDKKKLLFVLNHQNKLAEATNVALPESVTAMEGLSDIAVQYDSELIVSALEGFISNTIKAVVDAIGRFITIIRDFIVNLYHRIIGKKSQLDGIIKKTFDNVNEIDEKHFKTIEVTDGYDGQQLMIAGVTVATGKQIWSGMHQTLQHISDALRAKKHGYAEIHKKTFTHELTTMLRIYLHDGNAENYQKIGMVPHEEKLQYTFDRKVLKSGTVGELNIDLNNFSKMLVKAPELINATGKDQQVVIGVLDKFIKSYNDDMDKIDINDTAKYENIKQVKDQLTFARSVILVYGNVATTWVNELTSIGSKTRLDKNIVDV